MSKVYDDDDIELLEVRYKRRIREDILDSNDPNPLPSCQTEATPSSNRFFEEPLDYSGLNVLTHDEIDEGASSLSKSRTEDESMVDTTVDLTEKGCVKLPSLRQILPKADHILEPEGNIDRPIYNEWAHCEGFVAWWDNRTGKGLIVNYRYGLEHKIEFKDIKYSNYGALVPGSMVEYEYCDDGIGKGLSKIWVVSGCEYVLLKDAWENEKKYVYMMAEKQEHYERSLRYGGQIFELEM